MITYISMFGVWEIRDLPIFLYGLNIVLIQFLIRKSRGDFAQKANPAFK